MNRLLQETEDPLQRAKALAANLAGLWCYRVGVYRVICLIEDEQLVVLVVGVSHRCEAYR